MGRKIPVPKRHFGVRDPLKQLEEREEKIKDKINNPPKNINEQEVSKQFKKFVQLKASAKSVKKAKKFHTVDDDYQDKIAIEKIKRGDNESNKKLLARVNRLTLQRKKEAEYAAKYNVEIVRNEETGEIKLKKKPKDEIEELMKKRREESKRGIKRKNQAFEKPKEPKLTSLQKLKMKKKAKKDQKNDEKFKEFQEYQQEEFKFGETVHEPPQLVAPRKAEKDETVPRPGKRDLLLSSMFPSNSKPSTSKKSKAVQQKIDKKGKRKNLPDATRISLEKERQNVVNLYRELKKKKPIVIVQNKNLEDF